MEKTQIKTDMQPALVSVSSDGPPLSPDSIMTTAVLNYIDYERKKHLAKQGKINSADFALI